MKKLLIMPVILFTCIIISAQGVGFAILNDGTKVEVSKGGRRR